MSKNDLVISLIDRVKEKTSSDYIKKQADQVAGWTWSFQLPSGCSAITMDAFDMSIDVCQFQPMIHSLMSFVWMLLTVMGLVRIFMWGLM